MKVTVENKKNLVKNLKVLIDKTTINKELEQRYEQIKKDVVLKGFRPGKVPTEIIKKQFGKAVYGEVIDKILKESSTKKHFPALGKATISGVLVTADEKTGLALEIQQIILGGALQERF